MAIAWQRLREERWTTKGQQGGRVSKLTTKAKASQARPNQLAEPNQINLIRQLCLWRQAIVSGATAEVTIDAELEQDLRRSYCLDCLELPRDATRADSQDAISSAEKTDFLECVHH
jgi:hypothetical protein